MKFAWKLGLGLFVGLGTTCSSSAIQSVPELESYDIPLPAAMSMPIQIQPSAAEARALLPELESFQAREGARWFVASYRPDLRTPSAIMGPGIALVSLGASDAEVGDAALAFVRENARLLACDPSRLRVAEVLVDGDRRQVILQQYYEGLEVIGGRVEVYLAGGKVVLLGSEFYPDVNVPTTPILSPAAAQAAAMVGIPFDDRSDFHEGPARLVVRPLVDQGVVESFLAYEVKSRTESPLGAWWSYVDAIDGTILSRENMVAHFDIPVTATADVQMSRAQDPYVEVLSPHERVIANSTDFFTDGNGFVNLSVPLNQNYTVTSELRGRWSNTNNQDGPAGAFSAPGTPGVPLDISWTDANSHPAERTTYYHHNIVHDWVKALDPGFTGADYVMSANVNITSDICNAFWNGSSINFYKEGGGCSNSGQIATVISHEFHHGVTQFTYSPGAPPSSSGMNEAFSDVCAMTIADDPVVGPGFNNGNGFIRTGANTRQYPAAECGTSVHCLGEPLMGAMWKSRVNLVNTLGFAGGVAKHDQLFRATVKNKQYSHPNFLTRLLMNDDDNADLGDGTPNWFDLCAAFEAHNLPCPAITKYVEFTHTELTDQSSVVLPYVVTTLITAVNAGAVDPSSCRVHWSVDGGENFTEAVLTATGNPNEYSGLIPAQECGSIVTYYLSAETTTGVVGTEPGQAPVKFVHEFMTGPTTIAVQDAFEADLGWSVGAPGDAATAGVWQRVDPVGKVNATNQQVIQPEDDHTTNPSALCFVTDGTGGFWPNGDVDNGATTILSPVMDWSGSTGAARVDFWGFFTNVGGIDDTLRCSLSNDAGANWVDLVKISGDDKNVWANYQALISDDDLPFTSQMQVRFQIADFNSSVCEGAIDDILVRVTECTTTDVEDGVGAPATFAVAQNRPNPLRVSTEITFALPQGSRARIDVFDAAGRSVRSLLDRTLPAGEHRASWDGRDDGGRPVGSGVYYYRVAAGEREVTRKLLVLR